MRTKTDKYMNELNLELVNKFGYVTKIEKIVCPYCGEEWDTKYGDWEDAPHSDSEYECIECNQYFLVDSEPVTMFYYSSRKLGEERCPYAI